jgi:hypothetical protein
MTHVTTQTESDDILDRFKFLISFWHSMTVLQGQCCMRFGEYNITKRFFNAVDEAQIFKFGY